MEYVPSSPCWGLNWECGNAGPWTLAGPGIHTAAHLTEISRSSRHPDVDEDIHGVTQSLLPGHPQEKRDLLEEE